MLYLKIKSGKDDINTVGLQKYNTGITDCMKIIKKDKKVFGELLSKQLPISGSVESKQWRRPLQREHIIVIIIR